MGDWERPNLDAVLLASRVPYTSNLFVVPEIKPLESKEPTRVAA